MTFRIEKVRKAATGLLLIFVLVSIGFLFAKHSGEERLDATVPEAGSSVTVYYLHATFRCVSCNAVEQFVKNLLDQLYPAQMADGKILWRVVDFQKNEALAERFRVVSTGVVVALVEDGRIRDFERLDRLWTLAEKPEALAAYIRAAIERQLSRLPKGGA